MQAGYIAEKALAYSQITTLSTAVPLGVIPEGASLALVRVEAQPIRWRMDGTNPTASLGYPLLVGEELQLTAAQLSVFRAIESTAGAILNVHFFG